MLSFTYLQKGIFQLLHLPALTSLSALSSYIYIYQNETRAAICRLIWRWRTADAEHCHADAFRLTTLASGWNVRPDAMIESRRLHPKGLSGCRPSFETVHICWVFPRGVLKDTLHCRRFALIAITIPHSYQRSMWQNNDVIGPLIDGDELCLRKALHHPSTL